MNRSTATLVPAMWPPTTERALLGMGRRRLSGSQIVLCAHARSKLQEVMTKPGHRPGGCSASLTKDYHGSLPYHCCCTLPCRRQPHRSESCSITN
jgi:hypothetical protein